MTTETASQKCPSCKQGYVLPTRPEVGNLLHCTCGYSWMILDKDIFVNSRIQAVQEATVTPPGGGHNSKSLAEFSIEKLPTEHTASLWLPADNPPREGVGFVWALFPGPESPVLVSYSGGNWWKWKMDGSIYRERSSPGPIFWTPMKAPEVPKHLQARCTAEMRVESTWGKDLLYTCDLRHGHSSLRHHSSVWNAYWEIKESK